MKTQHDKIRKAFEKDSCIPYAYTKEEIEYVRHHDGDVNDEELRYFNGHIQGQKSKDAIILQIKRALKSPGKVSEFYDRICKALIIIEKELGK
jgi:hypothetical protein